MQITLQIDDSIGIEFYQSNNGGGIFRGNQKLLTDSIDIASWIEQYFLNQLKSRVVDIRNDKAAQVARVATQSKIATDFADIDLEIKTINDDLAIKTAPDVVKP